MSKDYFKLWIKYSILSGHRLHHWVPWRLLLSAALCLLFQNALVQCFTRFRHVSETQKKNRFEKGCHFSPFCEFWSDVPTPLFSVSVSICQFQGWRKHHLVLYQLELPRCCSNTLVTEPWSISTKLLSIAEARYVPKMRKSSEMRVVFHHTTNVELQEFVSR